MRDAAQSCRPSCLELPDAGRLCQSLEQAFGSRFSVWVRDGEWRFAIPTNENCDGQAQLLIRYFRPSETQLVAAEDRLFVVVPVTSGQKLACAVCGFVTCDNLPLARKLIEATVTTVEQARQLDDAAENLNSFAAQVTNDFEELTWLRNLAQHMELCELGNDVRTVAQAVLPPLRELLLAETVALLPPLASPASQPLVDSPPDPLLIFGISRPRARLERLVASLGTQARNYPLVRNAHDTEECLTGFPGVRSCILVQLCKGESQFGWLVVLNRSPDPDQFSAGGLNSWEFGTFEAGLVCAVAVMLAAHAHNVELSLEKDAMLIGVIRALINAIDAKDAYTRGHSDRVALIAKRLAEELGLDKAECERIYLTGLLHDVGKIGIPDKVLSKPGRLTEDEFQQIKQHPEIGHAIIKHVKQLEYVLPGVLHHHETFDGRGYPHALVGEAIPLHGRILAVADSYDAMTSTRPYRTAMSTERAEEILRGGAGTQWDVRVIEALFSALDDVRGIDGSESGPDSMPHLNTREREHAAMVTRDAVVATAELTST